MEFFLEYPMLVTYLFLKLDDFKAFLAICLVMPAFVVLIVRYIYFGLEHQKVAPFWKRYAATAILLGAVVSIIPSSKEAAIMYGVSAGVSIGKEIANSPITNKSLELLNVYVEKELDKAKKDLEKSK